MSGLRNVKCVLESILFCFYFQSQRVSKLDHGPLESANSSAIAIQINSKFSVLECCDGHLTTRPRGRIDYESIAHEVVGRMSYSNS